MPKPEEIKKEIAERLKLAREFSGLSQAQAAQIVGLKRPAITEIEAGRRNVTSPELKIFSDIYDVDVNWILKGEDHANALTSNKMQLAARELSKMDESDINKLFNLLSSMKKK